MILPQTDSNGNNFFLSNSAQNKTDLFHYKSFNVDVTLRYSEKNKNTKLSKVVNTIAHPIIDAIISTLKDAMPSHMVSGTA